jgi:hypothetical protein
MHHFNNIQFTEGTQTTITSIHELDQYIVSGGDINNYFSKDNNYYSLIELWYLEKNIFLIEYSLRYIDQIDLMKQTRKKMNILDIYFCITQNPLNDFMINYLVSLEKILDDENKMKIFNPLTFDNLIYYCASSGNSYGLTKVLQKKSMFVPSLYFPSVKVCRFSHEISQFNPLQIAILNKNTMCVKILLTHIYTRDILKEKSSNGHSELYYTFFDKTDRFKPSLYLSKLIICELYLNSIDPLDDPVLKNIFNEHKQQNNYDDSDYELVDEQQNVLTSDVIKAKDESVIYKIINLINHRMINYWLNRYPSLKITKTKLIIYVLLIKCKHFQLIKPVNPSFGKFVQVVSKFDLKLIKRMVSQMFGIKEEISDEFIAAQYKYFVSHCEISGKN